MGRSVDNLSRPNMLIYIAEWSGGVYTGCNKSKSRDVSISSAVGWGRGICNVGRNCV
jgi:hypothetical protein